MATIHAFEERGLGKAPFRWLREIDCGSIRRGSTCDFCGTPIRYLEVILSSDGKEFKVGCDCVAKTGDKGLIDTVKRERARARREAEWARRQAKAEEELEAQRARNGGKTDSEILQDKAQAERLEKMHRIKTHNAWIIEILYERQSSGSGFVIDMQRRLATESFSYDMSKRVCEILADIAARHASGKTRGAAYDQAWTDAYTRLTTRPEATGGV